MTNVQPDELGGVVRTIAAAIAGFALSKMHLDADTVTAVVGAVGTIAVAVWSVLSKRAAKKAPA